MSNDLLEKYQVSHRAIKIDNDLARSQIENVGAAVSYKPVEFIPLVVSWVFKTIEGCDFLEWIESFESFESTIIQIIHTAQTLFKENNYDKEMPYEVLMNDYGLTLCEYWRTTIDIKFKKNFHNRLSRFIMGFGVDHDIYKSVDSERPNWIILLTIGGRQYGSHDLTFAINLNQHLFFDPRIGEFKCKDLLQLCEFVTEYFFLTYPNYCKGFFMYLLDSPSGISVQSKNLTFNIDSF